MVAPLLSVVDPFSGFVPRCRRQPLSESSLFLVNGAVWRPLRSIETSCEKKTSIAWWILDEFLDAQVFQVVFIRPDQHPPKPSFFLVSMLVLNRCKFQEGVLDLACCISSVPAHKILGFPKLYCANSKDHSLNFGVATLAQHGTSIGASLKPSIACEKIQRKTSPKHKKQKN